MKGGPFTSILGLFYRTGLPVFARRTEGMEIWEKFRYNPFMGHYALPLNSVPTIMIVDDDPEMQRLLKKLFDLEKYEVQAYSYALDALAKLEMIQELPENSCTVVICDLKLPDIDGLEFLEKIKGKQWNIPVILITAHVVVETAVEALKKGAFDYVMKPIHLTELSITVNRAIDLKKLEAEKALLQRKLDDQLNHFSHSGNIIGKSQKIVKIFELIERVSKSNSNVFITGESGTGKEMIARSIHQKSNRKKMPFVAINCSAIPDQLLESELFGHRKGSFTGASENRRGIFEEAQGGTLFLDEIGDMPVGLQVKLLRVLQERRIKPVGDNQFKEINIRIISATHKNIRDLIQSGKFREDLFYRICVIPIHVPALRERKEDIPVLSEFFLTKYCEINKIPIKKLTKTALAKLLRFSWPGNVRELENTLERAVVLSDRDWIDDMDLLIEGTEVELDRIESIFSKLVTLEELEKEYIKYVLNLTKNAKEKAAKILGINRKTLYRKGLEYEL